MSSIFINGKDTGYRENQNFWLDPNSPDAFKIATLDDYYPEIYFEADHIGPEVVQNYCNYIEEYFFRFTEKKLKTIVEFGAAGGFFTEELQKRGYKAVCIEGTEAGVARCTGRGVDPDSILKMDLRRTTDFNIRFDIALCTEVAEHLEPPFHGTLVDNLTSASDLIWFSFEPPNTNTPHLHHPGEFPAQYWINLFEFFGYGCFMLPDDVFEACEHRGRMIFYNKEVYQHL